MVIERKFIERGIRDSLVQDFLERELERAEVSSVEIRRTPLNTRVVIHAGRPGVIIGKGGGKIKELTDVLAQQFKIDKPVLEVKAIDKPELDSKIVAKEIAGALERGLSHRRIVSTYLRQIMEAGAIGVEIRVTGKISGERARSERFFEGYIRKCGEPAERYVQVACAPAVLKAGVIGVRVAIQKELPVEVFIKPKIVEEKKILPAEKTEAVEEKKVEAETPKTEKKGKKVKEKKEKLGKERTTKKKSKKVEEKAEEKSE